MTETELPDKGDPSEWVELNSEEARCVVVLTNYYKIFDGEAKENAQVKAWADVQREFERLQSFKWFKL